MERVHVQRCTGIGTMNHERKTSNIEHRTLKKYPCPPKPFGRSKFEVRGSRFEVHGKPARATLHAHWGHEPRKENIEHRTSNSEKVPLPPETLRAFEVRGS